MFPILDVPLAVFLALSLCAAGSRIDAALAEATEVKLDALKARPFAQRLVERITWLGSPYL